MRDTESPRERGGVERQPPTPSGARICRSAAVRPEGRLTLAAPESSVRGAARTGDSTLRRPRLSNAETGAIALRSTILSTASTTSGSVALPPDRYLTRMSRTRPARGLRPRPPGWPRRRARGSRRLRSGRARQPASQPPARQGPRRRPGFCAPTPSPPHSPAGSSSAPEGRPAGGRRFPRGARSAGVRAARYPPG